MTAEDEITGEFLPGNREPWWNRALALVIAAIVGAFAIGVAIGGGCS